MAKTFSATEKIVESKFVVGKTFEFENKLYKIIKRAKPRPSSGECKTDLFILTTHEGGDYREFKISIKQKNADFLENKIKLERAVEIFGDDATTIISEAIFNIIQSFKNETWIYFDKKGRTEAECVTLGWKFELLNVYSGKKSGKIALTEKQKIDVYAGTNLSITKRNCVIDGEIVENCGIANYLLEVDQDIEHTLEDYIDNLILIEDYVKSKEIYFACKALNYRNSKDKWDGDRPLAVYIDWSIKDNLLHGELIYDKPFQVSGNALGVKMRLLLKQLDIKEFDNLKSFIAEVMIPSTYSLISKIGQKASTANVVNEIE